MFNEALPEENQERIAPSFKTAITTFVDGLRRTFARLWDAITKLIEKLRIPSEVFVPIAESRLPSEVVSDHITSVQPLSRNEGIRIPGDLAETLDKLQRCPSTDPKMTSLLEDVKAKAELHVRHLPLNERPDVTPDIDVYIYLLLEAVLDRPKLAMTLSMAKASETKR